MGFVLGLLQIAMQQSLIGVIKGLLQGLLRGVVSTVAGERTHAGNRHHNRYNYPGLPCPLALAVAPVTVPPPMQPRCMFSMCKVK